MTSSPNSYSILCDARKGAGMGITQLAMTDKSKNQKVSWTSDDPELVVKFYSKEHIDKVCARLKHNQPRVVDYWEAIEVIRKQAKAILDYRIDQHLKGD